MNCEYHFEDGYLFFIPGCFGGTKSIEHCTCETSPDKMINQKLLELKNSGILESNKKCCNKCAFRKNSPERCEPYGWLRLAESLVDGGVFVCHEGIPQHQHQIEGSKLKICCGAKSTSGLSVEKLFGLAYLDGREPEKKYE